MSNKEKIEYWVFSSYKNENDYNNNHPFFEKEFTDFNKMKTFSANHSQNKKVYPNYCSNYTKQTRLTTKNK
jgi:hypothetical protein